MSELESSHARCRYDPRRFREMPVEPVGDGPQHRLAQILFEEPPDPRDVAEILRLPVAPPQPREDADDLAVALRCEDCRRAPEPRRIEIRELREIAPGHRAAQRGRHVATG